MTRSSVVLLCALYVLTPASGVAQPPFQTHVDPACKRTLPVRLVQEVSGYRNVALLPRDSRRGAHGTCNYALGPDVILTVAVNRVSDPSLYTGYVRNCGDEHAPRVLADLGDEALACSAYGGGSDRAVLVRKGRIVLVVQSTKRFHRETRRVGESYFTMDQLTSLARAMVRKL